MRMRMKRTTLFNRIELALESAAIKQVVLQLLQKPKNPYMPIFTTSNKQASFCFQHSSCAARSKAAPSSR
jgi:hypothetical protein